MLAGTGFGDDPMLAHPQGEEGLTEGVVDLVGTCVVEVFPFQPDARASIRAAIVLAETLRLIERRGAPHVGAQKVVEALSEGGISPGLGCSGLQFPQGRHEGFRHVLPAEWTKAAEGVGSGSGSEKRGVGLTGGVGGGNSAGHVAARK
jgi:hypothetical protein